MATRTQLSFCFLLIVGYNTLAQNPVIFSVDKRQASTGDIVTIHGSDFGTNASDIKAFFGGASAPIKFVSNQLLQVRTPSNATFDPIRIINTSSGRVTEAPGQFFVNYRGERGITAAKFSPQSDFQAQSGLYDLCLCDFDVDGKIDVGTASNNANMISIFRNTSSPGNINFIGQNFLVNARTLHVRCGDLNGDALPDIVLSEASDGSRIFVLTNTGNFNFSMQAITLTGAKVKQVHLSDLDMDGRTDIVVTNTGGSTLFVVPNTTTGSNATFGTPVSVTMPGALSTDALAIGDLDSDGYPEIVSSQYQADNENKLFIARNQGGLNFSDVHVVMVNKAVSSIRLADLDADAKPDIVIARLTGSDISVYLNNSAGGLAFGEPLFFATETLPVGMDFGDFDGDGKIDIAVGSIAKSVSILNNTSTGVRSATFDPAVKIAATYINRNLRNADIDGDGKPDIVFTSVDDFSGVPAPASKISVLRNLSCMTPAITPGGPLEICTGTPLQLRATIGGGITYQWYQDDEQSPLKSGPDPFLDVTQPGSYRVVARGGPPNCSKESEPVDVVFSSPTATVSGADPDARSNSPVCPDNTLQLQVTDVGATAYRWVGPDGFAETVATTTLSRNGFSPENAGLYVVEMLAGTCVARTDSTIVESITIPDFAVSYEGVSQFCANANKILNIVPFLSSGFTYQWYEKSVGPISEATFESYSTASSGEYYVVVTPQQAGCSEKVTEAVQISAVEPPFADFDAAESACVGEEIAFVQQSSGHAGMDLVYSWTFGDGRTSGEASPVIAFAAAEVFHIQLKVAYPGLEACSSTVDMDIEVLAVTTPYIVSSAPSMCEGDIVSLSVSDTFTEVTWSTDETEPEITITSPGEYQVSTRDGNGCASSDEITIGQKPLPEVLVSADKQVIAAGQKVEFTASGADTYIWSPGKALSDSTISNPTASPLATTTFVVKGSLIDGCPAFAEITIQVSGEIVSIQVPVLFSPNGDEINPVLVIEGVENYPDCSLAIYDRRGSRVFSSTNYQNNWDGSYNGTPLPAGVYYYVFACPNSKSTSGTVTIIR